MEETPLGKSCSHVRKLQRAGERGWAAKKRLGTTQKDRIQGRALTRKGLSSGAESWGRRISRDEDRAPIQ